MRSEESSQSNHRPPSSFALIKLASRVLWDITLTSLILVFLVTKHVNMVNFLCLPNLPFYDIKSSQRLPFLSPLSKPIQDAINSSSKFVIHFSHQLFAPIVNSKYHLPGLQCFDRFGALSWTGHFRINLIWTSK